MSTFYAQPYDIDATGFYFETEQDYSKQAEKARNKYGQIVEEFEIQFIDGEPLDSVLCSALGIYQNTIGEVIALIENLDEHQKTKLIIAVGSCGYSFDPKNDDPDAFDVDIYEQDSMRDLAIEFADEGLFGDIPEHLSAYIDYDAIARDLEIDYSETFIAGKRLIYRCG